MAEQIIFYVLGAIIAIFSIMAVTSKQIIRSATYLLFVLLGTAGLYLLMGYNYLFAVQIAVYAGGVMVLFIFAILLTNKPGENVKTELPIRRIVAGVSAVAGLAFCGHVIYWNIKKVVALSSCAKENKPQHKSSEKSSCLRLRCAIPYLQVQKLFGPCKFFVLIKVCF